MSENNDTFLENETTFWDGKRDYNLDSNVFQCGETECSGSCDCKDIEDNEEIMTFCGDNCDETYGHCLDCEINNMWLKIVRGESSKETVDEWISLKTCLISCLTDQESDAVQKLKKEVQALQILRDKLKE